MVGMKKEKAADGQLVGIQNPTLLVPGKRPCLTLRRHREWRGNQKQVLMESEKTGFKDRACPSLIR